MSAAHIHLKPDHTLFHLDIIKSSWRTILTSRKFQGGSRTSFNNAVISYSFQMLSHELRRELGSKCNIPLHFAIDKVLNQSINRELGYLFRISPQILRNLLSVKVTGSVFPSLKRLMRQVAYFGTFARLLLLPCPENQWVLPMVSQFSLFLNSLLLLYHYSFRLDYVSSRSLDDWIQPIPEVIDNMGI